MRRPSDLALGATLLAMGAVLVVVAHALLGERPREGDGEVVALVGYLCLLVGLTATVAGFREEHSDRRRPR